MDQFHKSQNATVPYPTVLYSEQKCAHLCVPYMEPALYNNKYNTE